MRLSLLALVLVSQEVQKYFLMNLFFLSHLPLFLLRTAGMSGFFTPTAISDLDLLFLVMVGGRGEMRTCGEEGYEIAVMSGESAGCDGDG